MDPLPSPPLERMLWLEKKPHRARWSSHPDNTLGGHTRRTGLPAALTGSLLFARSFMSAKSCLVPAGGVEFTCIVKTRR